ncbi:LysR family transcriptional regulator [uncultured Slackia sp.]|uniref:LysR family transcriptional regulator n=1 Tax=uncultured Slackia sp. TaxID=665903 RepID=UPI002675F808|nr:LysR family transcriptional regulator [uncultured Slackia sp.]
MLNINNLFYFFKTVECGSYAAAAKELYLTPQAVSNGVSSLEQELGLELVNKNRPKATPTPTGLTIFEHSLDIFESISNLEATAKLTREANPSIIKGHLRVAISSFLAEGVLSNPFWHDFQRQYTNVTLSFISAGSDRCLLAIEQGEADVCIVLGAIDGIRKKENYIFSIDLQPFASPSHPLTKRSSVSFSDICKYPIIEPSNAAYCNSLIQQQLERYSRDISFFSLGSWENATERFLIEKQGILFASEAPNAASEAKIKAINLFPGEGLSLSVFYLQSKDAPADISLCLGQYLSTTSKALKRHRNCQR